MRRLAALATLLAATAGLLFARPAPAAPAPSISVSSVGAGVYSLHLSHPVTVPAGGLSASFGTVSTWGAVIVARQARGTARLIGNSYAGVGVTSDGHGTATQHFGTATTLPAGSYALYVLAPAGYRLSVKLSIPGAVQSDLALWSRRPVATTTHLEQELASAAGLTDRFAVTARQPSGLVVLGNTIGGPLTHDLAVCLVEGTVPAGAEMRCGNGMTSYQEDADLGAGDGSIALELPSIPKAQLTAVIRAYSNGLGTGLAVNALQWTWTAPATTAVA